MAEPQAKKQKTSKDPIILTKRKNKPDVRFFVFGFEFHVESSVLRVESEFFSTYLEPSGGVIPSSTSSLFKSDWHAKIDDDSSWHLTSDPSARDSDTSKFKGDKINELKAFHNFLCAMFHHDYDITDCAELCSMVELADYYRALPMLSASINGILLTSPGLLGSIAHYPVKILIAAYKLRNKLLFSDALICSLGPRSSPIYQVKTLKHIPQLYDYVNAAYTAHELHTQGIWPSLLALAAGITKLSYYDISAEEGICIVNEIIESAHSHTNGSGEVMLPSLCRSALNKNIAKPDRPSNNKLKGILSPYLESSLKLDKTAKAGTGDFKDHFLSFEIKDEDLPWDTTETDW